MELKAILKRKKTEFVEALTAKMLTYAIGRGVEPSDSLIVEQLAAETAKQDYRFSALVLGIVGSFPFQFRQKEMGRLR